MRRRVAEFYPPRERDALVKAVAIVDPALRQKALDRAIDALVAQHRCAPRHLAPRQRP